MKFKKESNDQLYNYFQIKMVEHVLEATKR